MKENENITKRVNYDAIVVGAGHAGVEAGLALARLGLETLVLSITLDNVGYLACNPSIGGTAKGHLVREVDALGGEMGIAADKTLTQLRMLNKSKGAAVQSLRAQVDKYKYHAYMKSVLEKQSKLHLRQGEAKELIVEGDEIKGVKTVYDMEYYAPVVVLACGVYLKSTIIVGDVIEEKGPVCFNRANHLSDNLRALGMDVRRFKTGTPARVKRSTIDLTKLEVQEGETDIYSFSALSKKVNATKRCCYLGYTNEDTHEVIRDNIMLSPKYSGLIDGVGARYCPSIEDKIVRFADKERHQFFLEPEGEGTEEMYVQGLSTGLPAFVQNGMYRSIVGFEKVEIMRDAYAIEYDCINPLELYPTLMHKRIKGLFFAGQINGTSGYEEAAAQGIVAGINGARYFKGLPPMVLTRDNSYIGVLIDDLVTVGTNEPYRMMTSRAEFRLSLRQDNADLRLTPIGREMGLVSDKRWREFNKKKNALESARKKLSRVFSPKEITKMFEDNGEKAPVTGVSLSALIRHPFVTPAVLSKYVDVFAEFDSAVVEQLFVEVKYEGYLARAEKARAEQKRLENSTLSPDTDYREVKGLRLEAAEKLNKIKPLSIGQAARISGVTPADVNVLIVNLKK
ncbi:MAG: tRNA uridine-5-carboxymethylaminomethyl(34) synthesis enzyme MnmG [Clostridia bacterium]|nr:tRNA uridine-5-carboxymethylaminomethyl(34) synthesis enzyme MnmG [Clostridia bacterium]MBR7141331.1 tRNA uridine-5-carboxymethylaminomethyl(34) synthesis enzyme MnmG [Clostridia bacterium]